MKNVLVVVTFTLLLFLHAPAPALAAQSCECTAALEGPGCNATLRKSYPLGSSITIRQIANEVPSGDCPLKSVIEGMEAIGALPQEVSDALDDPYPLTPETCGSIPDGSIAAGNQTYTYSLQCRITGQPDSSVPVGAGRTSLTNEDTSLVRLINPLGGSEENPTGRVNIIFILGGVLRAVFFIIGSLVLVVFVYGGFLFLTSAGSPDQVKKGMQTMLYAVLGLFVIFGSYAILNTIIEGLKVKGAGQKMITKCEEANPAFQCVDVSSCKGISAEGNTEKKLNACRTAPADVCLVGVASCTGTGQNNVCCEPK
ncbi:MAG: pilin [Patescibacteria group bacterium]